MNRDAYLQAIEAGDIARLRDLLRSEPELLRQGFGPRYAPERSLQCSGLHRAVHANQLESARLLLDAGIDIEAKTSEGRSALHDSIEEGAVAITELLLERGAHVDICSAAILGNISRLRELLDADPALANDRSTGLSPLGWAAFGNQVATAGELLTRGARMDDHELHCAASVGHTKVGELLIDRGADPNATCPRTCGNALHAAASMRYTFDSAAFVRMLLSRGADRTLKTTNGKTALQIAKEGAETSSDPARKRGFEVLQKLLK